MIWKDVFLILNLFFLWHFSQDPTLGHFLDPSLVLRRGLAQGRQEENLLADLDQDLQLLEEDLTQDQEVALALQIRGIEDKAGWYIYYWSS